MKKITKLTQEQIDKFPYYVKKWIDIGLCTDRADFEIWEQSARKCYELAKIKWPNNVIRIQSPIVGALAAPIAATVIYKILQLRDSAVGSAIGSDIDSNVYSAIVSAVVSAVHSDIDSVVYSDIVSAVVSDIDSNVYSAIVSAVVSAVDSAVVSDIVSAVYSDIYSDVVSAVYSAVDSAVVSNVSSDVRSAVYSAVVSNVSSDVRSTVYSDVGSAVYSDVGSAVDSKNIFWHYWMGGQFWSAWQSYIDFFLSETKIQLNPEIIDCAKEYMTAQKSACFWWPNKYFVMVCDRPISLSRNDSGRLHCENAKAIEWPDGWGLWMWNGVRVTEKIVMRPQEITIKEIQEENNTEIRRIMLERFGPSKFFLETGAEIIDMDYLNLVGSSTRALIKDKFENKWLICSDSSTSRVYNLPMSENVKTCKESHEQICGFSESRIIAES